jgi:hypothetical protein
VLVFVFVVDRISLVEDSRLFLLRVVNARLAKVDMLADARLVGSLSIRFDSPATKSNLPAILASVEGSVDHWG